jgi:hypothetical protein
MIMTTHEKKKPINWTLIACIGFTALLIVYIGIKTRVSTLTEQYRKELLVGYMNQDDKLRVNDCEEPIAMAISDATFRGKPTRVNDQIDLLTAAAKAKCLEARKIIAENGEKKNKLPTTPVPMNYLTKHFFQ